MNTRFKLDTDKLNLKFEGYKLRPFQEATSLIRFPLDGIQVYEPTNDQRLGFRDLQARIRHSNLIYGHPLDQSRGSSFCIDQEFNLHMIVYDKLTRNLQTHLITQLIKPLGSVPGFVELDSTVPIEPQLPSAVSVSRELLLASNGVGDIELIGMEEKDGKMLGTSLASVCYLGAGNEGISPVPCMLLAARQTKAKITLVVYSRTASKTTEFNIATLELDIPTNTTERLDDGSFVLLLKTLHIQTGPEVPVYCAITPSGKCIFGSEVRYNKVKILPHEDEVGGAEDGTPTPMDIIEEAPKQEVYQWSQEGADITVQFKLPENTPKSAISCKFVVDHVSLLVQNSSISYPFRKLWGTIQPDESLWTLEDNTLTLCMTKMDENTRWPQLFDKDDGIMETLSDHHLSEIKNRLAKFTSEDTSTSLVPNPAFVQAAQHPAATDMDEDVDDAGEPIVFGVYDRSGNVVDEFNSGTCRWICSSYEAAHNLPSVCLQMDVDGLVFTLTEVGDAIQIEHTATLDAFAFVQASKRDARFIHHDTDLHFASIIESSRNAYIYYHHDDKRLEEVQTLVDLTQGHDVDIMGAQVVHEKTLLILTESQLVLICLD
ncbi:tumor antigen cml66-l [Mucor ambiguus]|uniref:NudC domain-containing protein 1 n=1 Tax=Mucor ambiguus TaxID=91626 RepID=A0A0C9MM16_9FUNG|nr:tumor antigen cml66-l [Mucor ambiguus]